jgi:tRNA(Ile)-lysidine synthase
MTPYHFERRLAAAWPPETWRDVTVLVAVSGGADSVGLLRALAALKTSGNGRLAVAHFNHRLRPEAPDEARFVAELAQRLGLNCEIGEGQVAEAAALQGDGLEAAARAERLAFLQAAAERLGARYVVTAHTADDQAETVLHRILRGTGIAGLAGMRRARPLGPAVTLIRPLLAIRRAEILDYLAELNQLFCEDMSNAELAFTRNRLRLDLLPRLAAEYNPEVIPALVRLAEIARDAQQVVEANVEELLDRAVSPANLSPERVTIDCHLLAGANRHLLREMFVAIWREHNWPQQAMGFAEWDALAGMVLDPDPLTAPRNLPGNIRAQKNRRAAYAGSPVIILCSIANARNAAAKPPSAQRGPP